MEVRTHEPIEQLVLRCAEMIEADGIHAALACLNRRTRHRYTGLYRFEPPILHNLWLFDRENPHLLCGGDTPMAETYCSLVGAARAPFETSDATQDPRVRDHPARDSVIAYCGAPLIDREGTCFGSLCHFDLRPRIVPPGERLLLSEVAPLFAAAVLAQPG